MRPGVRNQKTGKGEGRQTKKKRKKRKGKLRETHREWICMSFGTGQGTNELPHRLPP